MKQNNLRKIEKEREAEKNSVFICVNDCMCVILYMLVRTQNKDSYRQIDTDRQTDSSQTDRNKIKIQRK